MIVLLLLAVLQPEIEVRGARLTPKFRLKDGSDGVPGTSVFSRELNADGAELQVGGSAGVRWGPSRMGVEYWQFDADGEGTLKEDKVWGGMAVPAGTATDTRARFRHFEFSGGTEFPVLGRLLLEPGLALEYTGVDADLGFGGTRLGAIYPTPQLRARWFLGPSLELRGRLGGFYIPWKDGVTSVLDPLRYSGELRYHLGRFHLGAGYELFHVHLEERSGHASEDVVHMRFRGFFVTAGFRF